MAGNPCKVEVEVMQGTRVRVTATFTALGASTPSDPTTVTFKVKPPDVGATVETYVYGVDSEVVRSSAGVFYLDVTCTTRGVWWVQGKGSGPTGINAVMEVAINTDGTVIS